MKSFWCVALVAAVSVSDGLGAISVGPAGLAPITFDDFPAAVDWSTQRIVGASGTIQSPEELDAAVEANGVAGDFTNMLATSASSTPQGLAAWSSTRQCVYTGPAGVAAHMLLATLRNDSGTSIRFLPIAYDLGVANQLGAEEVPGQRVYFSRVGAAYSWQPIPELSGITNLGFHSAILDVGDWSPGVNLYILWAQDNAVRSPDTCYTIDNFAVPLGDPFVRLFVNHHPEGRVTITWSGDGILQQTDQVKGSPSRWQDIPGATSGFSTNTAGSARFFRLRFPGF